MKDPKLTNSTGKTTTVQRPTTPSRKDESLHQNFTVRRNTTGDFGNTHNVSPTRVTKSTQPHYPNPSEDH